MINVKLMTANAYKTLQTNVKEVTQNIINHPSDSTWLKPYLKEEPFEVKKYTIEDFSLIESNDVDSQISNAIVLHKALKDLPRYILCDIRFWAWVLFEKCYKYAQIVLDVKESIVKNWWLPGNSRRDLMRHIVGRTYFRAEVSYDPSNIGDEYKLTRTVFSLPLDVYEGFVYRNISNLPQVTIAVLQLYDDAMNNNLVIVGKKAREFMKEVSRLGSVMLIDTMTKDDIYDYLKEKFNALLHKV